MKESCALRVDQQAGMLVQELGRIVRRQGASWDTDCFRRDIDAAIRYFVLEFGLSRKDIAGLLRSYANWSLVKAIADIAEEEDE